MKTEQSESAMSSWAENEVNMMRERLSRHEVDICYDMHCYESALKAFKSLCEDGHTGFSFSATRQILDRMCHHMPLCPITKDDFPEHCGITINDSTRSFGRPAMQKTCTQCARMSSLFQDVWEDGVVTYHDNDRVVCFNTENIDDNFYWGFASRFIDEMYPITLPYYPRPGHVFNIYVTQFTVNDMDVCRIDHIKEPSGKDVPFGRCFKYVDNANGNGGDFIEIDNEEYEYLNTRRDVTVSQMYASFIINDIAEAQKDAIEYIYRRTYGKLWETDTKYNLRDIWWILCRQFDASKEMEEVFNELNAHTFVFAGHPDAGWSLVHMLCNPDPDTDKLNQFLDKNIQFRDLVGAIQTTRERMHDILSVYSDMMDVEINKVVVSTGEDEESTESVRKEKIKEIIHRLDPKRRPATEEENAEKANREDCGTVCERS